MQKNHWIRYSPLLLSVLCLAAILLVPRLSAQTRQKNGTLPAVRVSPEDVRVRTIDWETYQAEALAAGSDLFWVHGSSLHMEDLSSGFTLTHFGFGGDVTFPPGSTPSTGNWVHFAIPTPTFIDGKLARLKRVIIVFDSPASGEVPPGALINRVDVWDGSSRRLSLPVSFGGGGFDIESIELLAPGPFVFTGVGISIHIRACGAPEFCGVRKIRFVTAGAELTR